MIQQIQKYYEGANLSGAVSSVINYEVPADVELTAVKVSVKNNITGADAVFGLMKNGIAIEDLNITIPIGSKSVIVGELEIALLEDDELDLRLASGSIVSPVVLRLTIDDGETVGGGGGTLATAVYTTANLANNAEEVGTIAMSKTFELLKTEVDFPCRVRLYSAEQYLLADASRVIGDIPTGEHGVIVDNNLILGNLQLDQMPIPSGTNAESPRTNEMAIKVQNKSGSSQIITVTFTFLILEV